MDFAALTNPIAFVMWIAVYILCALCFILKRGTLAVAVCCGVLSVAAITVTLVCGATLAELGVELTVLLLICLIARGCKV